ncbi:tyrosine-protein phosphatase [Williamsia maris]|uniref:tyrosine-protein phosphatase n=1 Tax=Williamsia maris TaxID=72806 RepID=UPI0020A4FA5D|nr:tyrosine-protein phosphatase [Williamsia maris]
MKSTTPRRAIAGLLASAALLLIPVAAPTLGAPAGAAPSPTTREATDRSLHLTGAPNARDFAGYRGIEGAQVNSKVIRSDNLSRITSEDVARLTTRSVRSVVDLRTGVERALQPDRRLPGAVEVTHDVLGRSPITTLVDLPSAYRSFVTDSGARVAIAATLRGIESTAAAGGTTLIHCTAGKDRTGWVSAVLLSVLGVDRPTIEADFLASNTYRHTSASDRINGVDVAWLRSSFATADARYGSIDGYVRAGLGLSARDITTLRSVLLTPTRR